MPSAALILGDQLFENSNLLSSINKEQDVVLMVESKELCARKMYHKQKLSYVLTCMRHYHDALVKQGFDVHYTKLSADTSIQSELKKISATHRQIHLYEPTEKLFCASLNSFIHTHFDSVTWHENPQFLLTKREFAEYISGVKTKQKRMAQFYTWHRKKTHILMEKDGKPVGYEYSFDDLNRKKLPKTIQVPHQQISFDSDHFSDVCSDIEKYFPSNSGILPATSWLPVTHNQSIDHLHTFFETRLSFFGDYEDAMTTRTPFVFHSVISPMLNNGLLTPQTVIDELLTYLQNHPELVKNHLNSVEGFIRQIIGWREWIKGMYDTQYQEDTSQYNFFHHTKPLPAYFWDEKLLDTGEIAQNIPLKNTLKTVFQYAYCHHIERLMVLGNWMVLQEYDPHECFEWFSCMFVDAYEWVMVPNVYGMGLFADGGIFASKPYIAGGNYIKKMSDYPKGDWEKVWTDAFWRFLLNHEDFFATQPRLAMLIKQKKKSQK
jgi:deoxyribodipyrimidine photolyase-related protein